MLIAFAGLPGAGKTTLSRALARRIGAAWIRIDSVEGALCRAGLSFDAVGPGGYDAAMAVAADNLANGLGVVADGVNPVEASRAGWRAVAARAGCPVLEVEVVCSDAAEHRRRVEARPDGVPGLPRVTWARVSGCGYEPWRGERLVIDTARLGPEEALDAVVAALPIPVLPHPAKHGGGGGPGATDQR